MSMRRFCLSLALFATAAISPESIQAQQPLTQPSRAWIVADALGYGTLGFVVGGAVGIAATSGSDCGFGPCMGAVLMALGGGILGSTGGAMLGVNARKAVAEGRGITRGHQAAMELGGIVGGLTLGALISSTMINGEGSGTPLGSDEMTFWSLTGAGAVAGAWFVSSQRHQLDRIRVSPTISHRRYGLDASLSF
ncbi:MAG TPA: hypothetical protein VJL35_14030 [Gemmatimonadaceae bacterium]|nr:hypothetical protein [Gemmatimonadaceae bacterium]